MDNSDNHRSSKVPIRLSVASELEPVECSGSYCALSDGFVIEFALGTDNYTIAHTIRSTRLSAKGLLSYDIDFCDKKTESKIVAPFGSLNITVVPLERRVDAADDTVSVFLRYTLVTNGAPVERKVDVTARFLS